MSILKDNANRSDLETEEYLDLMSGLSGGFCVGGYSPLDRVPKAFAVTYTPDQAESPLVEEISYGEPQFWGQPNMLHRLSLGIDLDTFVKILEKQTSDGRNMWQGTQNDLVQIVASNKLDKPSRHLPIREAIDWVYSSIYTTIKAMKFANMPPVCGGPIEVAVITSDRPFRWVRHKELDTAIGRHPARDY